MDNSKLCMYFDYVLSVIDYRSSIQFGTAFVGYVGALFVRTLFFGTSMKTDAL